ncbi:unnamed protein product [Closterium sp. NIES-64]|nr:unnamed protein product [Closterium sp. NIES-64]
MEAEGSAPAGPSGSGGVRGAGEAGRGVAGGSSPIASDSWSLEWIRAQVLQEEFRRKELTATAGEGGGSAYGMKGFKGRGSKKGKAKEGSGGEQYSGGKRSNKGGKRCGGKCWYCHVEGHPWFKCRKLPDGWRPGQPSIEGSKGVHGAMGEGMGSEEGDGGAGGHGGMFYHVGEACSEDMVVPASKVSLHRSSHWVIDTGAFMTMTNREDLLDEALSEAGMKMEMMGTKVFKATLDGRLLWDLRGGKDMHRSMWEIPVLPWKEAAARLAAEAVREGHASHVTSGGGGDGSDGAEGEAVDVEEVLQQGEAPIAERGDTDEEVQQPTPSPKLPSRRTTQGKRDAVRGGAKEGAAKERPKRAAHPRDFLKYERLGVPKALLVQEEEYEEEKGAEGEMEQICCFGVNLPHEPAMVPTP